MTTARMRAVMGRSLESLDGFALESVPLLEPGPGHVRLKVYSVGLGFADGLLCTGRYQLKPALPYVPGCEFAGVIDALGPDVSGCELGQRCAALALGGGCAEYAVVPVPSLVPLPTQLDFSRAAAFWVDYTTAFHALHDRASLQPAERVLVLGAAGGLGLAAVQIARLLGAQVIGAASTADKREAARTAGAHHCVDSSAADWTEQLKGLTHGLGVDVIFDPVGGDGFERLFRRLAWGGRHLVLGFAGGGIPSLATNLALLKGAALMGVDIRQFALRESEKAAASREQLVRWVDAGALQPVAGITYGLNDFRSALASTFNRQRIGKTIVTLRQE
ncbi:NADPH:quinone oxidoreductase family protein [Pseudomonas asiatica]|uniref:NADPH:quinone oxidoreductase family protein n=1 Tax=Pseudomonas asiatica TaxID=2219225 RepID=UPI002E7BE316|nr:NADPH:quinone oxidoreductase family protein [Pseudomonas asiatica]MEE1916289.1 NADPH:quinone oxidoreductase family protein [Pseudomonas asiatica]